MPPNLMAMEPPVCAPAAGRFSFLPYRPLNPRRQAQGIARPSFRPIKLPFGNWVLTKISVWLET
jgi:hypothetical protein